jgi:alkyldihydroxyacetonephosphate synthase
VGRDHHRWYLSEVPQLFTAALGGAEAALNPAGIMNPGVLMQPARTANYHHEREGERQ